MRIFVAGRVLSSLQTNSLILCKQYIHTPPPPYGTWYTLANDNHSQSINIQPTRVFKIQLELVISLQLLVDNLLQLLVDIKDIQ